MPIIPSINMTLSPCVKQVWELMNIAFLAIFITPATTLVVKKGGVGIFLQGHITYKI